MLCGELLNGGLVSAGAVPVVPCGLLGLWLPGCLRATSPRSLTSPYLTLLAEIIISSSLEQDEICQLEEGQMDLATRNHLPNTNGSVDIDLDLDIHEIDEDVLLGEHNFFIDFL